MERLVRPDGSSEYYHDISAAGRTVAMHTVKSNATAATTYFHTDHLGSVQVTSNQAGAPVERFSYDVFGKRRNVNGTDDAGKITLGNNINGQFPRRGYTGHEMLDSLSLVHMNGRVYDPGLGRVLSADPIIQAPDMSQSYNRYSYVMNGPLSLTDPSGYSWWTSFRDKWLKPIAAIAVAIYAPQISGYLWGAEFGVASACYAMSASTVAMVQGATAGFLAGAITGGTMESAFYGAISGASFGWLHAGMDVGVGKVLAHGMAGGIMGAAQGGDFGSSFLSAAFTQGMSQANVFGNPGAGLAMRVQNAVAAAIVGGTAAVLGGGKFANGAVTGAMSRLLNDGFRWPLIGAQDLNVKDKIGEGEGWYGSSRGGRLHQGIDIEGPVGTLVVATASGTVVSTTTDSNGYGKQVVIDHGDGVYSQSAHMDTIRVSPGTRVESGDLIGTVGRSGNTPLAGDTHLHFEIRLFRPNSASQGGTTVDPFFFIKRPN